MGKLIERFRESIYDTFVRGSSSDVEFFSAVQVIAAGYGLGISDDPKAPIYMASVLIGIWQLFSVIPFMDLVSRHWSNFVMIPVTTYLSYLLYLDYGIKHPSVGGYLLVAGMAFYCAYKTNLDLIHRKKQKNHDRHT
jgi:hypothetical protein